MNLAISKPSLHLEGDKAWQHLEEWLASNQPSKVFVLVDEHTMRYCLPILTKNIRGPFEIIQVPAGENSKTLEWAEYIWGALLKGGADRTSLLINLGGGVVTDLGGFIGGTYMRGIRFIHIPTSLLGQVDASIGGKTGIDFHHGKNLIGTFSLPEVVLTDPGFLATLPEEEWLSGFAEIIKHALIHDKELFDTLKGIRTISELSPTAILRAAAIKKVIVGLDPLEENMRRMLNFGHTIGHALESSALAMNTTLRHGDAVAAGMLVEALISCHELGLQERDFESIRTLITLHFPSLPTKLFDFEALMSFMRMDKKNRNGEINMALIIRIGEAKPSVRVNLGLVEDALLKYGSFYQKESS